MTGRDPARPVGVRGPRPAAHPGAWDPRDTFGIAGSEAPIDRRTPERGPLWPHGRTYER